MRRILVLGGLLALMLGVAALKTGSPSTHSDPLTLAAIGFVVLLAFTISELGSAVLSLPRVTGYILAGLCLGPSAANILSHTVVSEMGMFNSLALGLIATGAGLELNLSELKRIWRLLSATVAMKVVLTGSMVAGAVIGLESAFSVLGIQGAELRSVAIVLGALSVGTSPAIALAVINDSRAKGSLADLVLGAAVLKDVVLVVLMAIAVALAQGWLSGAAGSASAVVSLLAHELGGSLLAGSVLGALLIGYLRFVGAEMLLFVAAMILAVTELGRALHLDLLLVFIVAGCVVRNFSRYTHDLEQPLQLVALPVFVVFFTIAGASIDTAKVIPVLPLAAALAVTRAFSFWITSHAAGALTGAEPKLRRYAWQGYLPQAGVTLGLLGLAATALPEISAELSTLGVAVVATNLLIGPLTLRGALKAAGEALATPSSAEKAEKTAAAETQDPVVPQAEASWRSRTLDPELRQLVERLEQWLLSAGQLAADQSLGALSEPLSQTARTGVAAAADPSRLAKWLEQVEPGSMGLEAATSFFRATQAALRALKAELPAQPALEYERTTEGDSFRLSFRKLRRRSARLFGRGPKLRHVPVRSLARIYLEPRCAALSQQVVDLAARAQCSVWLDLTRYLEGELGREETLEAIEGHLSHWEQALRSDLETLLRAGLLEMVTAMERADTPMLPLREIRYSDVADEVEDRLSALPRREQEWRTTAEGAQSLLRLRVRLLRVESAMRATLEETAVAPAQLAAADLHKVLTAADRQMAEAQRLLTQTAPPRTRLTHLRKTLSAALSPEAQEQLERRAAAFRGAASSHAVATNLRSIVDTLPEELTLADPAAVVASGDPSTARARSVPVRKNAHRRLQEVLLPKLDSEARSCALALSSGTSRARAAIDVALYALDEALSDEGALTTSNSRSELALALERAHGQLNEVQVQLGEPFRANVDAISNTASQELGQLAHTLLDRDRTLTGGSRSAALQSRLGRAQRAASALGTKAHDFARAASQEARRLLGSPLSHDLQQRYSQDTRDVASIREFAARWSARAKTDTAYARLFEVGPTYERRLFTARDQERRQVIEAERGWLEGSSVGSVLVVGAPGSGRTSLLNITEPELGATRVLRPEPVRPRHDVGPLSALALELGCRRTISEVAKALSNYRTSVLVDDLEQWFVPDAKGMRELERFLDLVARTRGNVFWIVTVSQRSLDLLDGVAPVKHAFGRLLRLEPLRADALRQALETRHALSGRPLSFEGTAASRLFGRFRQRGDAAVFFQLLSNVSDGNLRRAISTWLHACQQEEGGTITLSPNRALQLTLPAMHQLPPTMLAVLTSLDRFGPADRRQLARQLRISRSELERHLAFLLSAGLMQEDPERPDQLGVPAALKVPISLELQEAGL